MRRIVMRVRASDVDVAYDRLLPLVASGLHPCPEGEEVVLIALGEEGELPPVGELAGAGDDVFTAPLVEEDAGDELASALAAIAPRYEIAGRVVLRTPAHPAPAEGMIDVVLARDLGFGTGAHPTTRHCIELLLDVEPGGSFADLGCGAGALFITAAKLGYESVLGIDFIDEVTDTAVNNAEANGVDSDVITGDLLALTSLEMRVVAVNISEIAIHEHLVDVEFGSEALIVSGLDNPHKLAHALAGYQRLGLEETRRIDALGWPAVLLRREP